MKDSFAVFEVEKTVLRNSINLKRYDFTKFVYLFANRYLTIHNVNYYESKRLMFPIKFSKHGKDVHAVESKIQQH